MAQKIVCIATHGVEDPERATLALTVANGAQAMDVEAVVVWQGAAVYLAKKGILDHVFAAGLMPLKDLVDNFLAEGGKLYVCTPCLKERKIDQSELIDGAQLISAGILTEELISADASVVY